jgi:transcriptional regulator GlxA family with amidase domain
MSTKRLVAVLFDDFELLDLAGPLEFFGMTSRVTNKAKGYTIETAAMDKLPKRASDGQSLQGIKWVVDYTFQELVNNGTKIDILLVPGGLGTRKLVHDEKFLQHLRSMAAISTEIASVCTGAALLGKSGLLKNKQATTNKLSYLYVTQELRYPDQNITWLPKARWVKDGNIWTSSGVAAGADMGLEMISQHYGKDVARAAAKRSEYIWNENADDDPFQFVMGKL